jgi:crossover junction endodeoxyribonuclease RuvC
MVVMGIDPGSVNLGYGILLYENSRVVLIEAGVIKVAPKRFQEQILDVVVGLEEIFERHTVDEVAIEDIFYAYNPKSVLKLAQMRGAVSLKVLQSVGEFYEYTPLQIKKALVGNGKASKEQVAFMVKRVLRVKGDIKPFDVSDALATAICHIQRIKLR